VQHKGIASLTFQRIDNLRIARGAKGHRSNRLRLTPGKECRSVRLGQDIDLTGNRANRAIIAPVNARLARQNTTADNALLKALKNVLDVVFRRAFLGR